MNDDNNPTIKQKEYYALIVSFIYFFCILASYYIIRPIREQLSAEVGSAELPGFFALTFLVTLIATPLFAWLVSHWSRQIILPLIYFFFIICELAFIPFFIHPNLLNTHSLGIIFFVWVSVFNLFVVSVFWIFMTDIWSEEQSKRLFPIIAFGGTLGAIIGPLITRELVEWIGIGFLLLVSSLFLMIAIICILLLSIWARKYGVNRFNINSEKALGGNMFDGLKQIVTSPFIRNMALIMLLNDAIGTIAYILITDYSGFTFSDAIARTHFAANIDMATNILQIIVQLTVTRWLLMYKGVRSIIIVWAILNIAACLAIIFLSNPYQLISGSIPWLGVLVIVTRALSYGMIKPAFETLFTLVPRELRYKGKNAIDTVVWRIGDLTSSLSINGLHLIGIGIAGFSTIGTLLIVMSAVIGWKLTTQSIKKNN